MKTTAVCCLLLLCHFAAGAEVVDKLLMKAPSGVLVKHLKKTSYKTPPEPEYLAEPRLDGALPENHTLDDLFEYHNPRFTDDGEELFEGDILMTKEQRESHRFSRQAVTNLWSMPINFYVGHRDRAAILAGVNHWRQHTCITFQESTSSSKPYLSFYQGSGCWSYVGQAQSSGPQQISIGSGCTQLGTVIHEIGHAMGLHHQQTRTDRDQYVIINYGNIQGGTTYNFQINRGTLTHGVPYDLTSVMHYGTYAFSSNGGKTITTKNSQYQGLIGGHQTLSHRDMQIANIMYGCADHCGSSAPRCQNGGYVNKNCLCSCPPHASGALCQTTSGSYYFPGTGPVVGSDCGDEDMRTEGTITSPNYPENFPKNVDCLWKITAPEGHNVKVTMGDMKVLYRYEDGVCHWDYINYRYTGGDEDDFQACDDELKGTSYTSTGREFNVLFHSGNYGWYRGFSATVEFVSDGGGECRKEGEM